MTAHDLWVHLMWSMICNVILLFCLFQPNIIYFIHRHWFIWRTEGSQDVVFEHKKRLLEALNNKAQQKAEWKTQWVFNEDDIRKLINDTE